MSNSPSLTAAGGVKLSKDIILPVSLIGVLVMMLMPMPPFLMDMALSLSIGFALCLFLAAIYIEKPLDLAIFPSLLLISTLARLAMNVATTRLILLHGSEGPDAAGRVISTFGNFVVGGNYVVGVIIFLVLVIINFIVITKGAGRIAEVGARFVLDAMPGKQMAIDADLSSGLISEAGAKARRLEIQSEADFYGTMDGASKFVRGDAIAGLLITGINIVGGFIVGITQQDMTAADAAATFTILTVGDGLVSQIPSLLISTAAGLVVTRSTQGGTLSGSISNQLLRQSRPVKVTAYAMGAMALVPGFPAIPFLLLGAGLYALSRNAGKLESAAGTSGASGLMEDGSAQPPLTERERLAGMLPVEMLEFEVGYELVPLIDVAQGGELTNRVASLRRSIVTELGIILSPLHVRDNLRLGAKQYRLLLSGNEIGQGEVWPGYLLALNPGGTLRPGVHLEGIETVEPTFGLPAWWIKPVHRALAENNGFTVVDPTTVMVTHITELLRTHAHELLGRSEVQDLLDIVASTNSRVVEELIPGLMSAIEVGQVLKGLLKEGVSIRDLRSILEALGEFAGRTKDIDQLVELCRVRLGRQITHKYISEDERVYGIVLDTGFENEIRQNSQSSSSQILGVEPRLGRRLLEQVERMAPEFSRSSAPPVLIASPDTRRAISDFIRPRIPGLGVLSYAEISTGTDIVPLGVVGALESSTASRG
ncbi:MAG: flagellar biosynthesis protein FlhA [Deltaproteobacteria bacterium]|nr:flagellar biosynthesis protein FlhA [Deltaproteobacteria bacterium]